MTGSSNQRLRIRAVTQAITIATTVAAGSALAEPVALTFLPPQIDPMQVCVARPSDNVITGRWESWEGGAFFTDDFAAIKADIRRLEQIDPVAWKDTLLAAFEELEARDPKYTETHALLDRIELHLEAGEFSEVENQRLVQALLDGIETRSPRFQNAAARYLEAGIGVERDPERANALLVASAYAGNADAMLTLTSRVQDGETVSGWDVDPELAITMAFGALVGELNPTICDRIWRIAREFKNGDIVAQDYGQSETWFRFAADLGDGSAAWKVVEFHLKSDGFEKNNDHLLKYLTQAADLGLPYAQVELGIIYERGAIVPKDLGKARDLFRKAVASNSRQSLTRYALFLEVHAEEPEFAGLQQERIDTLRQLSELPSPPAWVFTRLAATLIEQKGRWAAEAEARELLETAVELGDGDAYSKLAEMLFRDQGDIATLDRGLDLLTAASTQYGSISAMNELVGAYMCRAPAAPRLDLADYWRAIEQGTDSASLDLSLAAETISGIGDDMLEEASLQTQALYGRPSALAVYLTHLRSAEGIDPEMIDFWTRYTEEYDSALSHLARISFELAATDNERWSALQLMREAMKRGRADAAIRLAEILLEEESEAAREEARSLLAPQAALGSGDALNLMLRFVAEDGDPTQLYETFAQEIDTHGDFQALAFALPLVAPEKQEDYIGRMVSSMICDFKSSIRFSEALAEIGRREEARKWLEIAESLADDTPWKLVKMGDSYRDSIGAAAGEEMMANYRLAWEAGSSVARFRLLDRYMKTDNPEYDPDAAAELLVDALHSLEGKGLGSILGRVRGSDEAVRAAVERRIDLTDAYRRAAEAGNVAAMREYGYKLRDRAMDAATMTEAMNWIETAAAAGDASAMFEISRAYAFGIGVAADSSSAARWLEQAADAGHSKAIELAQRANLTMTAVQ